VGPELGVFILIVTVIGAFRWDAVSAAGARRSFCRCARGNFVEAARALGATKWRQVVRHILRIRWDPSLSPGHRRRGRNPPGIDTVVFSGSASARHSDLGPTVVRLEGLSRYRPALALFAGGAIFLAVLSITLSVMDCATRSTRARYYLEHLLEFGGLKTHFRDR